MENENPVDLEPLDRFGKFIMENLRDRGIHWCDVLLASKTAAPSSRELQKSLAAMSDEQRSLVRRCVVACLDVATHDFLFKLHERADFENDIQILVDGVNVENLTEAGLHYEVFCDDGWQALFSRYGEAPEEM